LGKPSLYAAQPYAKAEGSVSSGTGLPGLSWNKGRYAVDVVIVIYDAFA